MEKEKRQERLQATFKSLDTEEWLDIHFTRPIGLWWANLFNRFGYHPNVITVISMFLGFGAGVMFYFTDFVSNLLGVLLLMWANFYDSADGQLARMTGKTTKWGRILDGFAGDVWFYSIYFFICLRLMNQNIPLTDAKWNWWIFALCALAGLICHAKQCQLADYYRNIHTYFSKGIKDSEFDTSERQRTQRRSTPSKGNFWWRMFLWGYGKYISNQERMTPRFQKLIYYTDTTLNGDIPKSFGRDFREKSLPLMKYTNILTFNTRAIVLYASCLLDVPWIYPIAEITLFSALAIYLRQRHEHLCKEMLQRLQTGFYGHT